MLQTLAYLLPALSLAFQRGEAAYKASLEGGADAYTVQALIVAPSQELCMQVGRAAGARAGRTAVQTAAPASKAAAAAQGLAAHTPAAMACRIPGRRRCHPPRGLGGGCLAAPPPSL